MPRENFANIQIEKQTIVDYIKICSAIDYAICGLKIWNNNSYKQLSVKLPKYKTVITAVRVVMEYEYSSPLPIFPVDVVKDD